MKYLKAKWNQGAAGALLLFISVIQGWRFGLDILQELDDGNAFILGGPSLWYATALFPTMVGVGYFVSWVVSIGIVEIKSDKMYVEISEKKSIRTRRVRLHKDKIISTSISNTQIGWESVGLILLVISSYWLAIDAITLLTHHAVFGMGIVTAQYYLFQVAGNLIAVFSILFMSPVKTVIRSTEVDRVEFDFPLVLERFRDRGYYFLLKETFGVKTERPVRVVKSRLDILAFYGLFLVVIAIVTRIFNVYSSEPLRFFYIFIGLGFLTHGIKVRSIGGKRGWWDSGSSKPKKSQSFPIFITWGIILVILATIFSATHNLMNLPWETPYTFLLISNFGICLLITVSGILIIALLAKGIKNHS